MTKPVVQYHALNKGKPGYYGLTTTGTVKVWFFCGKSMCVTALCADCFRTEDRSAVDILADLAG